MNHFGVFLLMLSGLLAAQIPVSRPSRVALTTGVNRSWTAPFPFVQVEDGGGSSPVVRMRADAEVTMPVRQRFALQFGAAYTQKGEVAGNYVDLSRGVQIEDRRELDYLEFGVLGRLDLPYESKAQGLHLLAGPAVAVPLACRTGSETAQQLEDCSPTSLPLNVLLSGGAGVDLRLNETLDATLGFLYGLNLRETFDFGGDHLRTLTLRAGLVYRLN